MKLQKAMGRMATNTSSRGAMEGTISGCMMARHMLQVWCLMLPLLLALGALTGLSRPAEASAYTQGAKSVLFIRVDFPDLPGEPITDPAAQALIKETFDYYVTNSYNTTSLKSTTVTPVFRMSGPKIIYEADAGLLMVEARQLAAKNGFDYRQFDQHAVGFGDLQYAWAGLGFVGAPGSWLKVPYFDLRVTSHEFGHNFGLPHANYWNTTDGTPNGAGQADQYGDDFDAMGIGGGDPRWHFNTHYKNRLDWIPNSGVQNVTASGSYRIDAHDNAQAAGLRALKIQSGPVTYWAEYRKQFNNPWLLNGASIRWRHPGDNGSSELLDMSPNSAANEGSDKQDSALVVGRTFSDRTAKVHITPIQVIPGTPDQLEINVNLGDYPGNGPPQVKITASTTTTLPGQIVDFTASATDPDGDTLAYYWDFGDRLFGDNAATTSHSWAANGDYIVRCTVSDMKGGTGSASVAIKVGDPNSLRVSGRVLSTCGSPVSGADVKIVALNKSTITDTDGTYTLTGVKVGAYDVTASDKGTAIAPANFTNPLNVDGDKVNINFGAKDLDTLPPTITITRPLNGATVATLATSGTAQDNTGGCGIERIEIDFERKSDGFHWNGQTWTDTHASLSVAFNGTIWSKLTGLPLDKDLAAGDYHIKVTAFDKNFNSSSDEVSVHVPAAPTITITKPVSGATLAAITEIAGTANEPDGNALTVRVSLQRLSDNRYFNGSSFVISNPAIAPTLAAVFNASTGLWKITSGLPAASLLTTGAYRVIAYASTPLGRRDSATISFIIDKGAPFVAFTKPLPNGQTSSLASITGYALDNPGAPGATGISQVQLTVRRNSDGKFWTGSGWGASTILATSLTDAQFANGGGQNWSAPASGARLPNASETAPGAYTLQATAFDKAGNVAKAVSNVTVDNTLPQVKIVTPANNSIVNKLNTLGSAFDTNGSGIDKVTMTMQRQSDGKYWDGKQWVAPSPAPVKPFPGAGLLVGSYNGGQVLEYDAASGVLGSTFTTGLKHPESIAFGSDLNNDGYPELFVAERSLHRVLYYDGKTRDKLGIFAQGGGLLNPTGLAFMPDGDLLVATGHGEGTFTDSNGKTNTYVFANYPTSVKRYDIKTRAYLGDFVIPNSGNVTNGFEGINWGNDADGDGVADLYVAALFDDKVPVYSGKDGSYIRDFVAQRDGGLKFVTDVTFGPDNTNDGVRDCYVASSGTDAIKLYDGVTGAFVSNFVQDQDGATSGLNGPERAIFGPDGNLYVCSFGSVGSNAGSGSAVLRYDSKTGAPLPATGKAKAIFATGNLNGPAGITFNPVATGQVTTPPPGPVVLITPTLTTNYAAVNGAFARNFELPTGANLLPGRYILSATGFDKAGNSASDTVSVVVGSTPTITIITPPNGSTQTALSKVNGESKSAAGITSVKFTLKRSKDNLYWNGANWGAKTLLNTTLTAISGGVKWEKASGLPPTVLLIPSTYTIEAQTTDGNGVTAATASTFIVKDGTGGGGGGSGVTVSQNLATASSNTVKLVFNGPLDAASAMAIGNYTLTINGATVAIQSVAYSASNSSVLLRTAPGSLRGGDTVQVAWANLRDANGNVLNGRTDPFAASP